MARGVATQKQRKTTNEASKQARGRKTNEKMAADAVRSGFVRVGRSLAAPRNTSPLSRFTVRRHGRKKRNKLLFRFVVVVPFGLVSHSASSGAQTTPRNHSQTPPHPWCLFRHGLCKQRVRRRLLRAHGAYSGRQGGWGGADSLAGGNTLDHMNKKLHFYFSF